MLLKLIYVIKVVQHLLSRPAHHILNLAEMHEINLLAAYLATHLNMEAYYYSEGLLAPSPSHSGGSISN